MKSFFQKFFPVFAIFFALFFIEAGVTVDYVEAKSKMGGRMFSRPAPKTAPVQQQPSVQQNRTTTQNKGSFSRGLMGGLMGGAIGAMLFGSLFGASGTGMGLLPILLLGGVAYFLFRRFAVRKATSSAGGSPGPQQGIFGGIADNNNSWNQDDKDASYLTPVEQGIEEIQRRDRDFDRGYFLEIASDVFFQVQAGWMRRDLDSYRHLLGERLANEYAKHFAEMEAAGHINKLESIAIRKVEMVNAGSDGEEDFVTILFTANLLDYTVNEHSGEVVAGSDSVPVKFAEEWSWARPTGTDNWRLEGIKVIEE